MMLRKLAGTIKTLAFTLAAAAALPALATDYYWIGGDSGDWANGANWSLTAGGEAAGDYPRDYSVDGAYVTSAATITLPSANANVSNLVANANVSLTGGKIRAKTFSGSGKLTMLDGTSFYASEGSTVSADVEIPAGATVYADTSAQYAGFTFTAECALTGSGTIQFKGSRPSHPLYWDASGFSGTVVVVQDSQNRNNTTIRSASATHGGMSWQVANSGAWRIVDGRSDEEGLRHPDAGRCTGVHRNDDARGRRARCAAGHDNRRTLVRRRQDDRSLYGDGKRYAGTDHFGTGRRNDA